MHLPILSKLPAGVRVRDYLPSDLEACLAIYRSNIGEFLPEDIELFTTHLAEPLSYYLIAESPSGVLACGGLIIHGDCNLTAFTFGMVHRDLHRHGLGSLLVLTRLALPDGEHDPARIILETTLTTEPFYRRFGFERVGEPEPRYTGGAHYVHMEQLLVIQERDRVRVHLATLPVTFELEFPNPHPG